MADYEREVIQSVCHSAQWVQNIFEVAAETFKVAIIWLCFGHFDRLLDSVDCLIALAS